MTISEIQAATWEHREKKPVDLVTDNNPLLWYLKNKGRSATGAGGGGGVRTIDGGRVIWINAKLLQNSFVQHIDPNEEINLGYNQTLTTFEYSPKIIVVPVVINALEKAQNQGDSKFVDLLMERNEVAEASLMNAMETDLQGDGTGFGGKAFAGIQTYIVTSTSSGSYGGLSRSTYSSIRNASFNAPTLYTGNTDSSNIESRLRISKNSVVRGTDGPKLLLAGSGYFNSGADAMSAKSRFTQDQDMLKANFDNYMIEGMTCVLANGKSFSGLARIATDRGYGIDPEAYALLMYRGYNFQPVDNRVSFNQLVDASITVGIGQFVSYGSSLSFVQYDS